MMTNMTFIGIFQKIWIFILQRKQIWYTVGHPQKICYSGLFCGTFRKQICFCYGYSKPCKLPISGFYDLITKRRRSLYQMIHNKTEKTSCRLF